MRQQDRLSFLKKTTIEEIFRYFPQKSQRLAQVLIQVGLHWRSSEDVILDTLEMSLRRIGKNDSEAEALFKKIDKITKEQNDLSTISMTKKAAMSLKTIMKEEKSGWFLKFRDILGNCGNSYEYILDFYSVPDPQDKVFYSQGIEIHVPQKSLKRLLGSRIHYEESSPNKLFEGLLRLGFTITNPNIKDLCPCACNKGYRF